MPNRMRFAPNEARSRPVVNTGRLLNCQLGGDNQEDNTAALRLQRLRLVGIIGQRAEMLAGMVWGEAA
jgi:hypothetical protein